MQFERYTALINWGDGSSSYGVISGGTGPTLTVTGSHTFADPVNKTVSVQISHNLGYTTTATVYDTATVTSLGQTEQAGEGPVTGFWHNNNGQALITSFNGGSGSPALAAWLATGSIFDFFLQSELRLSDLNSSLQGGNDRIFERLAEEMIA